VPDLTWTNVKPQQQQTTSNIVSANTRIYSAKRTRGIYASGSGATTSLTTTRHRHRFHHRFSIQSVQTASQSCAARSVAVYRVLAEFTETDDDDDMMITYIYIYSGGITR
jgi:hypothetical protein